MRPYFFVRTQQKIEISLLDMFNNIRVQRYEGMAGASPVVKTLKVPLIMYYGKDFANWWAMTSTKQRPIPLPILALRFVRKEPASAARTQPTYARQIFSPAIGQYIQDIQPTPYYFYYDLELLSDSAADWQIVNEQINPYFNPFRTLRIKEFDFTPDIERKVPVYLMSVQDTLEDELQTGPKHRLFKTAWNLRLEADYYRPLEFPEMIKYAEMNVRVEDIIDQLQVWVYPDPIAEQIRKPWEELAPSLRRGFTLLKSWARTLMVVQEPIDGVLNNFGDDAQLAPGGYWYVDLTLPDAYRPPMVPQYKELWLTFDEDSPLAKDFSGFGRDFLVLDNDTRVFYPDLPPAGGNSSETGYEVAPNVEWDRILNWFGSEAGEMLSPFTFQMILQFTKSPVPDTIFQYLPNKETKDKDGNIIPEGAVYFDWGLQGDRLYFTFKTYGAKALFYTYRSTNKLVLNKRDIYKFMFVLYDKGYEGVFAYSINNGPTIALETTRTN